MKQRSLFDTDNDPLHQKDKLGDYWKLYIDGASRNNPGLSGAGVYLLKNGIAVEEKGFFLGIKTNNQAEYLALLLGLFFAKKYMQPTDLIEIISDSQLLVRQLEGTYRVKHSELKPLYATARALLYSVRYCVTHVMREDNKRADALANKGVDERVPVPSEFVTMLKRHEISWHE